MIAVPGREDEIARAGLRLRRMTDQDVARVMDIETRSYEFPWTVGIFQDCIRVGYCCVVFEGQDGLVAYAIMSFGAGEAHILNLCVVPESRGRGYGRMLLAEMMHLAREFKADMMFLEVRESNQAARHLYENMGFNEIGMRPSYYPAKKGREDALIMARQL